MELLLFRVGEGGGGRTPSQEYQHQDQDSVAFDSSLFIQERREEVMSEWRQAYILETYLDTIPLFQVPTI